ncbi:MAG: ubiquinol-cytochrome c reductase iron-sulfur subunit [Ideonella sp.]|nr:ubiquinol-cytochrome c reductase iron-sulfur subunit [Ideonella sp.]MCC7456426.1 ubiquinol-cytochrome c reductase iron-sulfur subunit [Nitrospira sp.]
MNPSTSLTHPAVAHDDGPDAARRRILRNATGLMGAAGLVATAVPFVSSFEPSALARARGGPVQADVSTLAPAELRIVAWRGQPVWLMRRTEAMVRALQAPNSDLVDPRSLRSEQPDSCRNATRSIRPELFVAVGICTHLGCSPKLRLDDAALNNELHAPGGFLCPCHGSRFDLAGRVVKDVPAPTNLVIPDYHFTSATTLQIGESTE